MEKLDLVKKYKGYYSAKPVPELVDVESAQFLSITGKGDPSGDEFSRRVEALYSTAYSIKFSCKAKGSDFVVARLEGLWWYDEQRFAHISAAEAPELIPRSEWDYQLLIRMPEFVTAEMVNQAVEVVYLKKQSDLVKTIQLVPLSEGKCVQMLHVGSFAEEPNTIRQIADFMESHKLNRNGRHHEIYLSDFRKTSPEKLKTILREPVL